MCNNIPYSEKEMDIIKAIYKIDPSAKFHIKNKLESRMDYLYGGIVWETEPISWEQVVEVMYKEKGQDNEN
jgi:hypothetical protein|tara:strand:- start:748 stop:960 length:213 start_codon:yes stop_codon:yes gene_type:complete